MKDLKQQCIVRIYQLASLSITLFNHQNYSEWYLKCSANSDGTGCQDRRCYNHGDYKTTLILNSCSLWLQVCEVNSTKDGYVGERRCTNYRSYLQEFIHETCSNQLSTCALKSGGIAKLCSVFNQTNCTAWLEGCTGTDNVCEVKSCSYSSAGISSYSEANGYKWYSYFKLIHFLNTCFSTCTCTCKYYYIQSCQLQFILIRLYCLSKLDSM